MRACNVLPDSSPIDVAAGIAQISNLGEAQPQGIVLMNEISHSISDELDSRDDAYGKCGRCGISTLTLRRFALKAILAGIREAIRVNRACMTRVPQNAGREKRRLAHSIHWHKRVRHWIFPFLR